LRIKKLICQSVVISVAAAALAPGSAGAVAPSSTLAGAGSTLVAPLVAEWIPDFGVFFGISASYSRVGSQNGVNALSSGSVDFAATDSPLTAAQAQSCGRCVQMPWALTAIGVGYHVNGAGNRLSLSGRVLAQIYLGKITRWNDPQIRALNPTVRLPALRITPIYANASGDSYAFTRYLSSANSEWRTKVGYGNTVTFPAGVAGFGNAGVTSLLASTNGAIGYVGAAYLITHRLPAAAIQNAAGAYVYPNLGNVTSAGRSVKRVPANNAVDVTNPPRSARVAYPISTFSYVVVSAKATAARKAALNQWIRFAVGGGQTFGRGLDFAPLPATVVKADLATVRAFAASK
jgi:phosphate transport system substrate-binding protein